MSEERKDGFGLLNTTTSRKGFVAMTGAGRRDSPSTVICS